jgi:hypothetical protein
MERGSAKMLRKPDAQSNLKTLMDNAELRLAIRRATSLP